MAKGLLSFGFSYEEDKREILYNVPWVVGKHNLVLEKWAVNLYSMDESRIKSHVWIILTRILLEF